MTAQGLLSVKEAASYLGVSPCTVYRLTKKGALPCIKGRGLGIRFKQEEIDSWLEKRKTGPLPNLDLSVLTTPPINSIKKGHDETGGTGEMAKAKSRTRLNFGYGAIYQRKTRDGRIRWYLDYRDAMGKRIQRVEAGASSREEAELALKKAVLAEGALQPEPRRERRRIKFQEFSRLYLEDYAMSIKKSWRSDKSRLKLLESYYRNTYLDEITPLSIQKYQARQLKQGYSKCTANRYLSLLKKMFNVAIEEKYLETSPAAKIKKFSEADSLKERILTEDEEARLEAVASPTLRSIINMALNTGMRLREILNLSWDQIDLNGMRVTVVKTKSGKPRTIPLNAALQAELTALKSQDGRSPYVFPNPKTGSPLTTIDKVFRTACRRAEISGLRFHDLRHTFGSRLIERGADIETVRSLLGHSSISMTQRYVHSTDERRRVAVEKLTPIPHIVVENGANL